MSRRLLLLVALLAAACGPRRDPSPEIGLAWAVVPDPPAVGEVGLSLTLTDARTGRRVEGAEVKLEGNMSHPGMKPVFGAARETGPGRYEARMDLTMAGDWIVLVDAALPDGRTLQRQLELRGVRGVRAES